MRHFLSTMPLHSFLLRPVARCHQGVLECRYGGIHSDHPIRTGAFYRKMIHGSYGWIGTMERNQPLLRAVRMQQNPIGAVHHDSACIAMRMNGSVRRKRRLAPERIAMLAKHPLHDGVKRPE